MVLSFSLRRRHCWHMEPCVLLSSISECITLEISIVDRFCFASSTCTGYFHGFFGCDLGGRPIPPKVGRKFGPCKQTGQTPEVVRLSSSLHRRRLRRLRHRTSMPAPPRYAAAPNHATSAATTNYYLQGNGCLVGSLPSAHLTGRSAAQDHGRQRRYRAVPPSTSLCPWLSAPEHSLPPTVTSGAVRCTRDGA